MPDHSIEDPFVIGKILSHLETRLRSQGPGRRGYDKAMFEEWTREELISLAEGLGLRADDSTTREQLVEMIDARDATRAR